MVSVTEKPVTHRVCIARGEVRMAKATLRQNRVGNGPQRGRSRPRTSRRDPGDQAHQRVDSAGASPFPIDGVDIALVPDLANGRVRIEARVEAHARTGVEMEALVAVAAAGLTLYDMCKAIDRSMTLEAVRLVQKSGGKSGAWQRAGERPPLGGRRS